MHTDILSICVNGEMSESAEGARLLSEYTSLNLYRGFKSLSLRHLEIYSSLCMTLTVYKGCFFYSLRCLQPSRAVSAAPPLHTALFTVFFSVFLVLPKVGLVRRASATPETEVSRTHLFKITQSHWLTMPLRTLMLPTQLLEGPKPGTEKLPILECGFRFPVADCGQSLFSSLTLPAHLGPTPN